MMLYEYEVRARHLWLAAALSQCMMSAALSQCMIRCRHLSYRSRSGQRSFFPATGRLLSRRPRWMRAAPLWSLQGRPASPSTGSMLMFTSARVRVSLGVGGGVCVSVVAAPSCRSTALWPSMAEWRSATAARTTTARALAPRANASGMTLLPSRTVFVRCRRSRTRKETRMRRDRSGGP